MGCRSHASGMTISLHIFFGKSTLGPPTRLCGYTTYKKVTLLGKPSVVRARARPSSRTASSACPPRPAFVRAKRSTHRLSRGLNRPRRVARRLWRLVLPHSRCAPDYFVFPWHGRNKKLDPTYSHIRRQALDEVAAALEPSTRDVPEPPAQPPRSRRHEKRVMSQSSSQFAERGGRVLKFSRKFGSSGWTRNR
jgi:hypothetical protein